MPPLAPMTTAVSSLPRFSSEDDMSRCLPGHLWAVSATRTRTLRSVSSSRSRPPGPGRGFGRCGLADWGVGQKHRADGSRDFISTVQKDSQKASTT
jgi:hypothetical protein